MATTAKVRAGEDVNAGEDTGAEGAGGAAQGHGHGHGHGAPAEGVVGVRVAAQDVIALIGRAVADERFPELGFTDPYAARVLAQLDVDPSGWDDTVLRAGVVRTMLFDDLTRDFARRHRAPARSDGATGSVAAMSHRASGSVPARSDGAPGSVAAMSHRASGSVPARSDGALGIGFFSGLCTRFSRVDDGAMRWLDVEHADVAQILADAQPARERQVISCSCSVACRGWMRHVREHVARAGAAAPVLVVVQGGLVGAARGMLDAFLTNVSQVLPTGSEILADFDARAPIRPRGRSLEAMNDDDAWVRYPRLRFLSPDEYPVQLERRVAGMNGIARLFHGRGVPALAHLRVA